MSMLSQVTRTSTAVLGTVNTTATSFSNAVNTLASTLDMADAFIQKAKEKQFIDNKFEMEHYASQAKSNALMNAARAHHDVTKELNSNPELLDIYNDMKKEFDTIADDISKSLVEMRAKRAL